MQNVNSTSITESVKHGDFEAVSIGTLEKISADWVRRASDRVQSAIKSQERKNAAKQQLLNGSDHGIVNGIVNGMEWLIFML